MKEQAPPVGLRPMKDFDPSQPAILHDAAKDEILTWLPEEERVEDFRKNAFDRGDGTIAWEGLILDGWGNVLGG